MAKPLPWKRADEGAGFAALDRLEALGAFDVVPAGGDRRVDVFASA